jgi:hypothetical protein
VVHVVGQKTHVDGGPEAIGAEDPDALELLVLARVSVDNEISERELSGLTEAVGLVSVGTPVEKRPINRNGQPSRVSNRKAKSLAPEGQSDEGAARPFYGGGRR